MYSSQSASRTQLPGPLRTNTVCTVTVRPAALEAVNLRVAESTDSSTGTRVIIARYPTSVLHLGYYVRITIKELNAGQTEVEVLSKKGQLADMPGNIGNSSDLFLEIGKRVYGT